MKLWVDDERPIRKDWEAEDRYLLAGTSDTALAFLEEFGDQIDEISLDHDLGGADTTRPVMHWLCRRVTEGKPVPTVHVHTANPVGREWLEGMRDRYLLAKESM